MGRGDRDDEGTLALPMAAVRAPVRDHAKWKERLIGELSHLIEDDPPSVCERFCARYNDASSSGWTFWNGRELEDVLALIEQAAGDVFSWVPEVYDLASPGSARTCAAHRMQS